MDAPQLEFDFGSPEANSSRIVRTVSTDLGPFGNRTDIIVVDGSTVGGASLIECADPDVDYFNGMTELREDDNHG